MQSRRTRVICRYRRLLGNHEPIPTFLNAKRNNQIRFSIKTLMIVLALVLIALIWVNVQFRQQTGSSTIGFGTTLNGLHGADSAHDRFETWLESNNYKSVERPRFGSQYQGHRESWYSGVRGNFEHYVHVRSSDSYFGANVFHEAQKWAFETNHLEESAKREVVNEIASWWDENKSTLSTQPPNRITLENGE